MRQLFKRFLSWWKSLDEPAFPSAESLLTAADARAIQPDIEGEAERQFRYELRIIPAVAKRGDCKRIVVLCGRRDVADLIGAKFTALGYRVEVVQYSSVQGTVFVKVSWEVPA